MNDLIKKGDVPYCACYYEVKGTKKKGRRFETKIPGRYIAAERRAKGEAGVKNCEPEFKIHEREQDAKDYLTVRIPQILSLASPAAAEKDTQRQADECRSAEALLKSKGCDLSVVEFVTEFLPHSIYATWTVREFFRVFFKEVYMMDAKGLPKPDGSKYWHNTTNLYKKLPPSILDKTPNKVNWSTEFNAHLVARGNAPITVDAEARYLSKVFQYFVDKSMILVNPAWLIPKIGSTKTSSRRTPTSAPDHSPTELVELLDFTLANAPELYPAMILLIGSGTRYQQMANYRWEYFYAEDGIVGMPRPIQKGKGTFYHANYLPRGLFVRLQTFFNNEIPRKGYVVDLGVAENPKAKAATYNARKKIFAEKINALLFKSSFKKMEGREDSEGDREPIRKLVLSMLKALGVNINFIAHFAGHADKTTTIASYLYRVKLRETQEAYLDYYPSDYLDKPVTFTPELAYKYSQEYLKEIGQGPSAAPSATPDPTAPDPAAVPVAPPAAALPAPQAPAASKGKKRPGLSPG